MKSLGKKMKSNFTDFSKNETSIMDGKVRKIVGFLSNRSAALQNVQKS